MSMGALEGLKILITGHGTIVRSIVTRLIEEDATVVLVGDDEAVSDLSVQVIKPPANDDWQTIVARVTHLIGAPTVVIDVAGMPLNYGLERPTAAAYARAVLGRIEGVLNAAAPGMTAAGGGVVICVNLPMGVEMQVGIPQWSVLRHAVHGLVRGWAVDLGDSGIRAVAIQPGVIREPGEAPWPRGPYGVIPLVVPGRNSKTGRPQDIAEAVVLMASEDAGYITGTEIVIDGGLSQSRNAFPTVCWADNLTDPWALRK